MGFLFTQIWLWLLIAFALGVIIGFALAWSARKEKVEVNEERVGGFGGTAAPQTRETVGAPAQSAQFGAAPNPTTPDRTAQLTPKHRSPDDDLHGRADGSTATQGQQMTTQGGRHESPDPQGEESVFTPPHWDAPRTDPNVPRYDPPTYRPPTYETPSDRPQDPGTWSDGR